MYIVNEHGKTHSIPDDWKLPAKARMATAEEIAAYDAPTPIKAAVEAPGALLVAGPSLEIVNALAERDAEIVRLQTALATAKKGEKVK